MSRTIRLNSRWATTAVCVGALALSAEGFQRPPPAQDPGFVQAKAECIGSGKGELFLPAQGQDGRMSAHLTDCDGVRQFHLEALLTGFLPDGPIGEPGYWFGGLYGRVWTLGDVWTTAAEGYGLQGGWKRADERCGTFWADALRFTDTGRLEVVGRVYGRFVCDEEGQLALTADYEDAAPPKKPIPWRYQDAREGWTPPPPLPYRDAESGHKSWPKTRYGDARDGWTPPPYRDAESGHKSWPKTRYGDARDGWTPPPPFADAATARKEWLRTRYHDARPDWKVPPYADAQSGQKVWPKTRYGDARDGWTPPPPLPYRDAESGHKSWPKTRFEDARDGWTPPPYRDAESGEKSWPKTRYRDAGSGEVALTRATIRLRFRFEL